MWIMSDARAVYNINTVYSLYILMFNMDVWPEIVFIYLFFLGLKKCARTEKRVTLNHILAS